MTNEICEVCNRAACIPAKLADAAHSQPWCMDVTQYDDEGIGRGFKPCAACLDCRANAVQWREQAIELRAALDALKAAQGWQVYGSERKPEVAQKCVVLASTPTGFASATLAHFFDPEPEAAHWQHWRAKDGDLFIVLPPVPQ